MEQKPLVVLKRKDGSVVGPFADGEAACRWLATQGKLPDDACGVIAPLVPPAPPEILGRVLASGRLEAEKDARFGRALAVVIFVLGGAAGLFQCNEAHAARRRPAIVDALERHEAPDPPASDLAAELEQCRKNAAEEVARRRELVRRLGLLRSELRIIRSEATGVCENGVVRCDGLGRPPAGSVYRWYFERANNALERDDRLAFPQRTVPELAPQARP